MKGVLRLALLAGCVLAWMPLTGLADASKSLLAAAAAQDEAGARRALSAGAAVNAQDEDGWSALTYAAGAGDAALVQTLLKAGANPNLATRDGKSPLFAAVFGGNVDVVKALLAAGARPVAPGAPNDPLALARERKRPDLVALLQKPATAAPAGAALKTAMSRAAASSPAAAKPGVADSAATDAQPGVPAPVIRAYLTEMATLERRRTVAAQQRTAAEAANEQAQAARRAEEQRLAQELYEQCSAELRECKNRCSMRSAMDTLGSMRSDGTLANSTQRSIGLSGMECLTDCESRFDCRAP